MISSADTLDQALDKVDTMCRLRHDQELAGIEPTKVGYRFEIRNGKGTVLARLTYTPDTTRPYQSVIVTELLQRDRPQP